MATAREIALQQYEKALTTDKVIKSSDFDMLHIDHYLGYFVGRTPAECAAYIATRPAYMQPILKEMLVQASVVLIERLDRAQRELNRQRELFQKDQQRKTGFVAAILLPTRTLYAQVRGHMVSDGLGMYLNRDYKLTVSRRIILASERDFFVSYTYGADKWIPEKKGPKANTKITFFNSDMERLCPLKKIIPAEPGTSSPASLTHLAAIALAEKWPEYSSYSHALILHTVHASHPLFTHEHPVVGPLIGLGLADDGDDHNFGLAKRNNERSTGLDDNKEQDDALTTGTPAPAPAPVGPNASRLRLQLRSNKTKRHDRGADDDDAGVGSEFDKTARRAEKKQKIRDLWF